MLQVFGGFSVGVVLSAFFLLVAVLSNILSTKATAVLFTPIAVGVAHAVNTPVEPFAVAVVFAANCSFASPVGYQTNLLVMGPGHYRFMDFVRAGVPLILLLWIVFSLFGPWYFGL
jgi:di/tricarboxylate transporter